jgi:hypothetical protein
MYINVFFCVHGRAGTLNHQEDKAFILIVVGRLSGLLLKEYFIREID